MKKWVRNAFAVEADAELVVDEDSRVIVDRLAREIVRRRLTTPALFALEMGRPLNYIGSQAMVFMQPIVSVLFDTEGYEAFARFMEQRKSVDYLCDRIEQAEADSIAKRNDTDSNTPTACSAGECHDED